MIPVIDTGLIPIDRNLMRNAICGRGSVPRGVTARQAEATNISSEEQAGPSNLPRLRCLNSFPSIRFGDLSCPIIARSQQIKADRVAAAKSEKPKPAHATTNCCRSAMSNS